jgi:hypothetical protein
VPPAPSGRPKNEAAGLWHDVPRLDRPPRLWIIPQDKAVWLGAGLAPAAVAVTVDWRLLADPVLWAVALVGAAVGVGGALVQPEGRSLPRWIWAWVSWTTQPKRASWRPGRSPLAW